jgi:protein-L-isoaspartate(D-aspartate) O-methyltransferase
MDAFERQRQQMVRQQIAARGVRDPLVLEAIGRIPREEFVEQAMREFAYEDSPLPIEAGQTISQPYIVALMIEAAEVRNGDRVLEVGAGSGYAAAVIAAIADKVYAIERHGVLARQAKQRFLRLGYDNIEVRAGDGSGGWPEAAPFDAILAAAGGTHVPDVLRRQLAIGGRLVMPVGETLHRQQLVRVTRNSENAFEQEMLEDVRFVPLIGEHGWQDETGGRSAVLARAPPELRDTIPELIADAVETLPDLDDPAFGRMFDRFADARVVLLGEASHGTSEFYRARAAITRRLIEAYGFRIVAVEADWPDAAAIDRYVRHKPALAGAAAPFQRFPTWMWRNAEVDAFVDWLRAHNDAQPASKRAGFYGLDLYSLNNSISAVIDYLDRVDPDAARIARTRYGCLTPWAKEPAAYGHMALSEGYARCERPVTDMLRELLGKRLEYSRHDGEQFLDATQNARLVRNAEAYYRAMYYGSAESWNLRDTHMFETLQHLLDAGGSDARAVVWAHNSHIGDARHTEMGSVRGELNIGQLCREHYGPCGEGGAALIGFGTHAGTVAAASDWDAPMQVMDINPSRPDSVERLFHDAGNARCLLDLREGVHPQPRMALQEPRLERFIGVIYRPDTERWSHYSASSLPMQFDAWTWFDRTSAVSALPSGHGTGMPDTYPFGL